MNTYENTTYESAHEDCELCLICLYQLPATMRVCTTARTIHIFSECGEHYGAVVRANL